MTQEERDKLLRLDGLYGKLALLYRRERDFKAISNIEEEFKKFMDYRERGAKYFPQIKCPGANFSQSTLDLGKYLLKEFNNFDCYLSEFYIDIISLLVGRIEYYMGKRSIQWYTTTNAQTPSLENFNAALDTIKEHPYSEVGTSDKDRNIRADKAAELIQAHIDKRGYRWKVELTDKILPRMSVDTEQKMYVKDSARFSRIDIAGLKAHEVDGHVGRRYYGLMTGLHLFHHGLTGRNNLDEGLAVYNSLHKCRTPKPNILFNTAIKTIMVYKCQTLDFCELFEYCKSLCPTYPDDKLFTAMIRLKSDLRDTSIMGCCGDDQSYFCGYQLVKTLTDEQRDDILKWNIGPNQLKDLPDIKRFFELNKFEPLIK